jgi:hypothetical protein
MRTASAPRSQSAERGRDDRVELEEDAADEKDSEDKDKGEEEEEEEDEEETCLLAARNCPLERKDALDEDDEDTSAAVEVAECRGVVIVEGASGGASFSDISTSTMCNSDSDESEAAE